MKSKKILQERLTAYSLVLPCTIVLLVMMIYPIIQVLQFSFSNVSLPDFQTQFVGLKNFERVLLKPEIAKDAANTVIWTIASLIIRFALGTVAALLLDTSIKGMKALRVFAMLPWIMPSIVAANVWRWLYSTDFGVINYFLRFIDPNITINWLGNPSSALFSVVFAFSWTGFPFVMLMLLAGLQGIPVDYKEAARIDGANPFNVFVHITVPCLKPVIVTLIALQLIDGINSFDMLFNLTAGGPGGSSEIFSLAIYRYAFSNFDFSGSSALSVMLIIVIAIPFFAYEIISSLRQRKNRLKEGA
jgi:multiple sugar transport system permease protein